jgi:hypothetical protein
MGILEIKNLPIRFFVFVLFFQLSALSQQENNSQEWLEE